MKRAARALLFATAVGVLVVTSAPAALLDRMLDRLSHGQFRLALASGTLWNGQARLATSDSSAALHPVSDLSWTLEPGGLLGARLRWLVKIDGNAPATLEIHPGGVGLQRLMLQLPPAVALAAVPHAIARAGWRGVLDLRVPALECTWSGRCEGKAHAEWRAGGVDILPGQALGDHRIDATIATSTTTLEIHAINTRTLAVNGGVELESGRRPRLDLELGGDAQLLDRLRSMLEEFGGVQDGARLRIRS
jgi:general secretion pathway protein N